MMYTTTIWLWVLVVSLVDTKTVYKGDLLKPILDGNVKMANAFYAATTSRYTENNVLFSPASLHFMMCLIYTGARGITAKLIADHMFVPNLRDRIQAGYQKITYNGSDEPLLGKANKIFVDKTFRVKLKYVKSSREYFNTVPENVDFRDPPAVVSKINAWVNESTEGRITEAVPEGGLFKATQMALVSSCHFKGEWLYPFDTTRTRAMPFHVSAKEEEDVVMMAVKNSYKIATNKKLGARILQMDFEKRYPFALIVILPIKIDGLSSVEMNLNETSLKKVLDMTKVKEKSVNVYLPKFEVESKGSINLALRAMGLGEIFKSRADFTEIASRNPMVSQVIHNVVLRFHEKGCEAKKGPRLEERKVPAQKEKVQHAKKDFVADRPFIYLIVWRQELAVLYMGRYTTPS